MDNYLLIQFENATCSSSRTECVVPSADVCDVPPMVLSPVAVLINFDTFEPKSLSCINSMYSCTDTMLHSLADNLHINSTKHYILQSHYENISACV